MKPNDTACSDKNDSPFLNSDASKIDSSESLLTEKELSRKKGNNNNAADAPFYDELHFGNYE